MSLEEPNEKNAKSLKAALENLIMKLGLNIKRKESEVCFISIELKLLFFSNSNSHQEKSYS